MMEVETFKGKILSENNIVVKMSISALIKSVSAVSPHNLSTGAVLRSPFGLRFQSREGGNRVDSMEKTVWFNKGVK